MARIIEELNKVLSSREVIDRFAQDGVTTGGRSGKAFTTFVAEETRRWGEVVHSRGITGE